MNNSVFVNICSRNTAYWHMITAFQVAANELGEKLKMTCRLSPHIGDSLISRARCQSLYTFLQSDCEWYFTLDDDVELPSHAMVKLIEADKDIIGGIYRLKSTNVTRNPFAVRFLNEDRHIEADQIIQVQYVSTGCIMHKRSFIEKLVSQYDELYYHANLTTNKVPALYLPYIYHNEYLSEDWAFCQRAMDMGHKIYMHSGVQCGHWGLFNYKFDQLTDEERSIK